MELSRLKAKLKDSKRKKPVTTPKSTPNKITVKKKEAKKQAEVKKKVAKKQAEAKKKEAKKQAEAKKKEAKKQAEAKKKAKKQAEAKKKVAKKQAEAKKKEAKKQAEVKKKEAKKKAEEEEQAKKKAEEEAKRTYEEELEEQLTEEQITDFQIHKTDMDKLINHICEIVATYGNNGIHQSDLWKKLKLTSRDGSRLALKLERMGLITREKILLKERWTYKLIIIKSPIGTDSLSGAPCLVCPVESKCSLDGDISPKTCQFIEDWVLIELKTKKSK
jgi:chemotaxis protein histidine kinase CheA